MIKAPEKDNENSDLQKYKRIMAELQHGAVSGSAERSGE